MTRSAGVLSSPYFLRNTSSNMFQLCMDPLGREKYQAEALPAKVKGKSLQITSSCLTFRSLTFILNCFRCSSAGWLSSGLKLGRIFSGCRGKLCCTPGTTTTSSFNQSCTTGGSLPRLSPISSSGFSSGSSSGSESDDSLPELFELLGSGELGGESGGEGGLPCPAVNCL